MYQDKLESYRLAGDAVVVSCVLFNEPRSCVCSITIREFFAG